MISRVSSEAFSYSYASISVLRVNVSTSPLGLSSDAAPQAGGGTTATPSGNDSLTLSPQALAAGQTPTAASTPAGQSGGFTPAPASTSTSATDGPDATTGTSPSQQKIAALIKALDSNGDGALSEEEFVDGAKRLLRGKHGHHHGHRAEQAEGSSEGGDGEVRRSEGYRGRGRGLEKRLEKAFGVIDANGDGSLSQDELVSALDRTTRGNQAPSSTSSPGSTTSPTSTTPATSNGTTVSQAGASTSAAAGTGATTAGPLAVPPQPATSETTPATGPSSGTPAPTGGASTSGSPVSFSFTSVTYVSVAIRQYSAVSQLAR